MTEHATAPESRAGIGPSDGGATGRAEAIAAASAWFDAGGLIADLAPLIAFSTESVEPAAAERLRYYLIDALGPRLNALGVHWRLVENPESPRHPVLIGERVEDPLRPTVLAYGHGDVVAGEPSRWRAGLDPWRLVVEGGRWYGRGTADNKGQHAILLAALARVLASRGKLGFNLKLVIETGEEMGSPGLARVCAAERAALNADLLIACDGPRLRADQPTVFLGARGAYNFGLAVDLRPGSYHSGNWGGLIANPGTILANAIASLIDRQGQLKVSGLKPTSLPDWLRAALAGVEPGEPGGPEVEAHWGEPGLTPAERVFGWCALEVLAFETGNSRNPVNAIPGRATADLQLRFVPGLDPATFPAIIRAHLDQAGFERVTLVPAPQAILPATHLDPRHPEVAWAVGSITETLGRAPVVLPSLGCSLPNDCFADALGLPTLWVPHSYPGCSQHAPDEHLRADVAREGLAIMVGLFWDLGHRVM